MQAIQRELLDASEKNCRLSNDLEEAQSQISDQIVLIANLEAAVADLTKQVKQMRVCGRSGIFQ